MQIVYGGEEAFNEILFPQSTNSNFNSPTLIDTYNKYADIFTGAAKDLFTATTNAVVSYANSDAVKYAKNALRNLTGVFNPNIITVLNTINDFQTAKPVMKDWVLACPEIQELYSKQRCSGYDVSYEEYKQKLPYDNYFYDRVIDRVALETDEGYVVKEIYSDIMQQDHILDSHKKFMILDTWENARNLLTQDIDPTNPFGAPL